MYSIIQASEKHSEDLTDFQVKMAMETENLKLDQKLVRDAIDYLVLHKQYGQFYVAEESQKQSACGSLLATYQNQKFWWIQSVYVKPQHRRKGNFTNLFTNLVKKAQENGVKSIKLYAEKQNEKAKETYKKLGMYCNGELFYGLDLVYGNTQDIQKLKQPYPQGFEISKDIKITEQDNLKFIFGKQCELNKAIFCLYKGKICGYCQYFQQFSQWRFGITQYIKFLKFDEQLAKQVIECFKKYLFENSEIKVGAIRFIVTEDQLIKIKQFDGKMHLQAYDVMAIDL